MPGYTVMLGRKAGKDYGELSGEYRGFCSRRVNRTDRVVYEIREGEGPDGTDAVVVARMRAHCRGTLSLLRL